MNNLVLWIIDEAHRAEQEVSEASVKKFLPGVETECVIVKKTDYWYADYIRALQIALQSGRHRILFLDSDTTLIAPVFDIFELLEKYQIVSTHAPARQTTNMPPTVYVPEGYVELNTGVFGFANVPEVYRLFDLWLETFYKYVDVTGDNDQAPLRIAMWEQGTNVYILPPEYNFRFGFGAFAGSVVKILHGRSENLPKLVQEVNAEKSMRTFVRSTLR